MSKEWIVWGNRADAGEQGVRGMPHAMHFGTGFFRGDPLRAVALFGFCRGFSSLTRQSQLAVQSHRRLQRNERFLRTNPACERFIEPARFLLANSRERFDARRSQTLKPKAGIDGIRILHRRDDALNTS